MTMEDLVKHVAEVNLAIANSSFDGQTKKLISRRFGFSRGYYYGVFGFARDWSEGDVWHRGFLYGKLKRIKQQREEKVGEDW